MPDGPAGPRRRRGRLRLPRPRPRILTDETDATADDSADSTTGTTSTTSTGKVHGHHAHRHHHAMTTAVDAAAKLLGHVELRHRLGAAEGPEPFRHREIERRQPGRAREGDSDRSPVRRLEPLVRPGDADRRRPLHQDAAHPGEQPVGDRHDDHVEHGQRDGVGRCRGRGAGHPICQRKRPVAEGLKRPAFPRLSRRGSPRVDALDLTARTCGFAEDARNPGRTSRGSPLRPPTAWAAAGFAASPTSRTPCPAPLPMCGGAAKLGP